VDVNEVIAQAKAATSRPARGESTSCDNGKRAQISESVCH